MDAIVIDDSSAMRMILRRIVTKLGFDVVEAENGRDALDRLDSAESGDAPPRPWVTCPTAPVPAPMIIPATFASMLAEFGSAPASGAAGAGLADAAGALTGAWSLVEARSSAVWSPLP